MSCHGVMTQPNPTKMALEHDAMKPTTDLILYDVLHAAGSTYSRAASR